MVGGAGSGESPDPGDDDGEDPRPGGRGDAELIEIVRRVDPTPDPDGGAPITPSDAFGLLYDRHVDAARALARQLARSGADADDLVATAFTRLLAVLRAGRGPTEAFRAYLLTSLRHLAYDRRRDERRVDLTDDIGDVVGIDPERTIVPFADPAVAGLERTLAARAFATLPERWQAVLWHLEVEGDSPADIAPLFGLTANAVSALAYRAREGLRQAYLQEHLSSGSPGSAHRDRRHRETQQRLGAYTRGGLARRDAIRVETHLAECAECRALAAELREVNSGMVRSVVAPLVLGAGLVGYLASRGSHDYLSAMWDPATGELPGARPGLLDGLGTLAQPGVLATLAVTAPSKSLALAAAGIAGVVGAVGLVGAVATGALAPGAVPRAAPDPGRTSAPGGGPTAPGVGPSRSAPRPPPDAVALPPLTLPPAVRPSTRSAPAPDDGAPTLRLPTGTTTTSPTTTPPTTPPTTGTGSPTTTPSTTAPPTTTTTPRAPTSRPTTTTTPRPAGDDRRGRDDDAGDAPTRPLPRQRDEPTRPLPLLDALGRVLAPLVSGPHR